MTEVKFTEEQEKSWNEYVKLNPQMLKLADKVENERNIIMRNALKDLFVFGWNHGKRE